MIDLALSLGADLLIGYAGPCFLALAVCLIGLSFVALAHLGELLGIWGQETPPRGVKDDPKFRR